MFHAIRLSKSDPTPLYIQLASELATLIQNNILQEGFKLPTIRFLSKQLTINRDTVVSAYKLLEQQGLVESYIGKGTYIAPHNVKTEVSLIPSPNTKPELCCSQLKLSSSYFPTTLCQELTKEIIDKEGWEAFSDPLLRHRCLLKQSIATYFETLGIKTHFAQIKITSNFNEFLLSLFKFFPKTGVCVESIRDLSISCHLRSLGSKIHEIPLTEDGLDLDVLEKHLRTGTISYIIVSPYLQNPTGVCYSPKNKQALIQLATEYDCYIIEDGSYCEFLLPEKNYMPLINLCDNGRVIYMYQFSKLYLPYMKYNFFIVPQLFNSRINDDMKSSFNERFLQYYLNSDVFSDLKTTILHLIQSHYEKLCTTLSSSKSKIQLTTANGGLYLWLKIDNLYYQDYLDYLTKHQVVIAPGDLFSTSPLSGYIRLSIGELNHDALEKLIEILCTYKPSSSKC